MSLHAPLPDRQCGPCDCDMPMAHGPCGGGPGPHVKEGVLKRRKEYDAPDVSPLVERCLSALGKVWV